MMRMRTLERRRRRGGNTKRRNRRGRGNERDGCVTVVSSVYGVTRCVLRSKILKTGAVVVLDENETCKQVQR